MKNNLKGQQVPPSAIAAALGTETTKKAAELKKAPDDFAFNMPATLVNSFQLALTPNYCRLAAMEIAHGGTPYTRAVLVFDYKTMGQLYQMLDGFYTAQKEAAAKGDENAKRAEEEAKAKTESEADGQSADGSQAKVG